MQFPALANTQPFQEWLYGLRQEALSQGISKQTLDEAFESTEPIDRIIELDRKQPETTLTFQEYLAKIISDNRISAGSEMRAEHYELLNQVSAQYGVQPQFIVALWGIETNYGNNMGSFGVIDSLATLAYDGRRSDFFRSELLKALKIIDEDHIEAIDMIGSWAGAMGQCQFMPSSFMQFAVDQDSDGKRDIWNTQPDVFASIANYLSSSGWNGNEGWGIPVTLPEGCNKSLADIKTERPVLEWQQMGVRTLEGGDLPAAPQEASVIFVGEGEAAEPYMVYNNYKVLLKWNRSRYFATAVGMLAEQI